uniref:Protein LTV1 homolog n=1 Tax=Rhabditophanes sp. KR3021 TaxID=114890 RepID=A0AC35TQ12_9BILA
MNSENASDYIAFHGEDILDPTLVYYHKDSEEGRRYLASIKDVPVQVYDDTTPILSSIEIENMLTGFMNPPSIPKNAEIVPKFIKTMEVVEETIEPTDVAKENIEPMDVIKGRVESMDVLEVEEHIEPPKAVVVVDDRLAKILAKKEKILAKYGKSMGALARPASEKIESIVTLNPLQADVKAAEVKMNVHAAEETAYLMEKFGKIPTARKSPSKQRQIDNKGTCKSAWKKKIQSKFDTAVKVKLEEKEKWFKNYQDAKKKRLHNTASKHDNCSDIEESEGEEVLSEPLNDVATKPTQEFEHPKPIMYNPDDEDEIVSDLPVDDSLLKPVVIVADIFNTDENDDGNLALMCTQGAFNMGAGIKRKSDTECLNASKKFKFTQDLEEIKESQEMDIPSMAAEISQSKSQPTDSQDSDDEDFAQKKVKKSKALIFDDEEGEKVEEDIEGGEDLEDEEFEEEEVEEVEEEEVEEVEELEEDVDNENEETLLALSYKKQRINKKDFFDDEASLSGSDVGSDDEEGDLSNDEYEAMEGDDDIGNKAEIKADLAKQFLDQEIASDAKIVQKLREQLMVMDEEETEEATALSEYQYQMKLKFNDDEDLPQNENQSDEEDDGLTFVENAHLDAEFLKGMMDHTNPCDETVRQIQMDLDSLANATIERNKAKQTEGRKKMKTKLANSANMSVLFDSNYFDPKK